MQSETLFRSWNKLLSSEDETLENETTDNVTDSEVTELTTLSNCFGFDLSESEKASWLADVLGFGCVIVIRGCSKAVWRERPRYSWIKSCIRRRPLDQPSYDNPRTGNRNRCWRRH